MAKKKTVEVPCVDIGIGSTVRVRGQHDCPVMTVAQRIADYTSTGELFRCVWFVWAECGEYQHREITVHKGSLVPA